MKVILIEDVKDVGSIGDIIQVKPGYARNFLFPRNLARPATEANQKVVEEVKRKKQMVIVREKKAAEELREKLSLASCTISVEAGDDDKLFGSVTAQDIAQAFEEEGLPIDKRKILLDEPIKKLGVYNVTVKPHPEVSCEVKVWVVKK